MNLEEEADKESLTEAFFLIRMTRSWLCQAAQRSTADLTSLTRFLCEAKSQWPRWHVWFQSINAIHEHQNKETFTVFSVHDWVSAVWIHIGQEPWPINTSEISCQIFITLTATIFHPQSLGSLQEDDNHAIITGELQGDRLVSLTLAGLQWLESVMGVGCKHSGGAGWGNAD